ncbi:MAG: hypothetical protein JWR32_3732 [Mycobacterium sp.]|jgi:uncharacterized OB-fold protein|nr:hypothetical protein [Mycobacterium sp.]
MTAAATVTVEDWLLDPALAPDVVADPIRPLYDAAARGKLALPFCQRCDLPLELEQAVCDSCGGLLRRWRAVQPRGVVHSATTMHRREPGLVCAERSYPIVDVELSSGHRLMMTTALPADSAPALGTTVRVGFRRLGNAVIPAIDNSEAHA